MLGKELNKNLQNLLNHLDSIKDTLPMTLLLLKPYHQKAQDEFVDFVKSKTSEIEEEDGEKSISIKSEDVKTFDQLSKNAETSNLASKIIPQSLFVSLISQYDAYLSNLLKILYKIRPEYINNSERELTFSQLIEFESIDLAREFIVEKEIETILRKSHTEHFEYLENKLGVSLRTNLPIWENFIEITQRRNLFVHCDGIVSNQYLAVCKQNNCLAEEINLNDRLEVGIDYFIDAYNCLYELTTKLTHTIWRKLLKDDSELADEHLNKICFDLLNNNQYELADILLDFACKQKKPFNDFSKNLFIVNRALSLYLQDKDAESLKVIKSKDWSASSDDFKLAFHVITKNDVEVFELMKKIGLSKEITKTAYKSWPLFKKLRQSSDFQNTYKEIFEEDYAVLETPKTPVQKIIADYVIANPNFTDE